MNLVKIGVLGAGRGRSLVRAMRYAPSAQLSALCDQNEERLAKAAAEINEFFPGRAYRTFTSYEEMLSSDIDAVLVASPMPLHVEHSIQALRAGKHVLCEVTAATSIEQCWELLEAVKSSDRKYMLAENYCYMRPWMLILGLVRAGIFGKVYYGETDQIQDLKRAFPHPNTGYNWRTSELALRLGHQYITHDLGPLYQAVGERMKTVVCMGSGQHHLDWAKADDTCVVLLETVSGKLLRIRLDFFSTRPTNYLYYALQGTGAAYEAPRGPKDEHKIHVVGKTPPNTWQSLWDFADYLPDAWKRMPQEAINDGHDGGSPIMIEDFAQCILKDTRPPIDVVDALNMTAPGLMSEVSRQRGGVPVEVPEFK